MSTTIKILVAVSCLLAGYMLRKKLADSPALDSFQDIFLKKILPVAVFCLIATLVIDLKLAFMTVGIYNVITVVFLVAVGLYYRRFKGKFNPSVLALGTTFVNSIMVGVPLFELFGDEELIKIIMLIIPIHSVTIFVAAPLFNSFTEKGQKFSWSSIKLPPITIALILGILFAIGTGGALSEYTEVRATISMVVQVLAYFTLGNMLSGFSFKNENSHIVKKMSLLKLFALPAFTFTVLFPFNIQLACQLAVIATLPTGVNSLGYAANFKKPGNNSVLSTTILYTTLSSLLLTPSLYYFFKYFIP